MDGMKYREYLVGCAMARAKFPINYIGERETEDSYMEYARKIHDAVDAVLAEGERRAEKIKRTRHDMLC